MRLNRQGIALAHLAIQQDLSIYTSRRRRVRRGVLTLSVVHTVKK